MPSEVLHITDSYTAFCFDEACDYITAKVKAGERITWEQDAVKDAAVSSPSRFYAKMGVEI